MSRLSPLLILLFPFLGITIYFLWTEHRAHVMGALPRMHQ